MSGRVHEVVLFCRMKNSLVNIITSGSFSSINDYRILHSMKNVHFQFPLHSVDRSIHDGMTRHDGSWENSVRSIREVLSLGGNPSIVIVLTSLNAGTICKLLEFIIELGARRVMLLRFNIGGEGLRDIRNLVPDKKDLNTAFSEAAKFSDNEKKRLRRTYVRPSVF